MMTETLSSLGPRMDKLDLMLLKTPLNLLPVTFLIARLKEPQDKNKSLMLLNMLMMISGRLQPDWKREK